jgi:hypothetical protein
VTFTDRFEELLNELSIEFGVALHPDKRGACKLRINETLNVQLECDPSQENLLIASFICEIPPGKFRENILKDALKCNGPFPVHGTLSYSERNNQLALFAFLHLSNLNGKTLADFITSFTEKVSNWRIGVETGRTVNLVSQQASSARSIFDIKK